MSREPIGLISHNTIGRTVSPRRDEAGIPIEESVPSLRSTIFYDLDGNEVRIPTHCHRAFVPGHDNKYRPTVVRDRLQDGFLEASKCPHMPREQLDDKPSITPPAKFTTCDGKGETGGVLGCSHLVEAVKLRRQRARDRAAARKNPAGRAAALAVAQSMVTQVMGGVAAAANREAAAKAEGGGRTQRAAE